MKLTTQRTPFGAQITAHNADGSQTTIAFNPTPLLLVGDTLTTIADPEQFGKWDTELNRASFVRAFVSGRCGNDACL